MKTKPSGWFVLLLASCLCCQLRAQTNLLLNPGLEAPFTSSTIPNVTGMLASNWTASAVQGARLACSQATTNVYDGASCQEVVVTGQHATNATTSAMFYQTFSHQAGSVYTASVWLRAATNSQVLFQLLGFNTAVNSWEPTACHIVTVGTNWQQVTINGGWQNGSNGEISVSFLTNGTFWIDDGFLADVTSNYLQAPLMNTTSTVPPTYFGMQITGLTAPDNWPPLQQGLIRLWSDQVDWLDIEPSSNNFDWTQFDKSTNAVLGNNPAVKILYTMGQTPTWAALNTNTPTDNNGPGSSSEPAYMITWSNYVWNVGYRYKGFIQYYEVWNETDSESYYTGAISNMVTMAQIARSVLTNIDSTIKILGPNITGGIVWLEQFIQAGGPPPDIVTWHDYMASRPENSLGELVGLRDMLSRYSQWSALPIWITEGSPLTNSTPQNVAQSDGGIVSRGYLFCWILNVQNWSWFSWDKGSAEGYVPLSSNPPSETPAAGGIAYSNTVNWLVGAQMISKMIDTNGTWAVGLQRLGFTNAYILWNPDVTTNYAVPASWNVYQMRDFSNNVTSLTGVSNITVGVAPIILDALPSLAVNNSANGRISLLWPAPATGFNLHGTTNLASASWSQITNAVANSNGLLQVTVQATNNSFFFRLSSP